MLAWRSLVAVLCLLGPLLGQAQTEDLLDLPLELITLPPGFNIQLYAQSRVPNARHLALGLARDNVTIVYVSSFEAGLVHALLDRDSDGVAETVCTLLQGLQNPNGIVWHRGALYVMETTQLTRYDGTDFAVLNDCNDSLTRPTVLAQGLPAQAEHPARALALGPDEKLYFSVAAPFNVGECTDLYCTIQRINLDGSGLETFAKGIRNVGGMAWSDDPALLGMFFSVLERDFMGDDAPDDLLAVAQKPGIDYGFPYCHWAGQGDPYLRDLGPGMSLADDVMVPPGMTVDAMDGAPRNDTLGPWCAENAAPPLQALGPHLAPLGVAFYPASEAALPGQDGAPWPGVQLWPAEYQGRLFVAQHGSWNRQDPIGYRIATVQVSPDWRPADHAVFAAGWLQDFGPLNRTVWGRPAGLLVLPDGSMLVTGDTEGAVYRISYEGVLG